MQKPIFMEGVVQDILFIPFPPVPEYRSSALRRFWHGERHITRKFSEYVLILMVENTLYFDEDGVPAEVTAGEWYMQIPDTLQTGFRPSAAPVYHYLHFTAAPPEDVAGIMQQDRYFRMPRRGVFDLSQVRVFLAVLEQQGSAPELMLKKQAAFLNLLMTLRDSAAVPEQSSLGSQVVAWLEAHAEEDIRMQDLARVFHFSQDHLTREVRRFSGETPGRLLAGIRTARARELLAHTDDTLARIALQVGYRDTSVFFKAFCKHAGMTPGQWRARSRGLNPAEDEM